MLLNYINFDGAERKICRGCVDKLWDRSKPETLKKVVVSIVYGLEESEEDGEEV